MSLLKDLPELIDANVISEETAGKIKSYYQSKENNSGNRQFIVFGILGAILVGLGIILIIAHNWDDLPRITKTVLAFLPLLIGQAICAYVLTKKPENVTWRESASAFLFFAVGATISLISQVYNISGDLKTFVLAWMLLCLPLIYIMRSSVTSILYIIGITNYACLVSYWVYPHSPSLIYWLIFLLAMPHYYLLATMKPESNFTVVHHWLIPASLIITLGTAAKSKEEIMFVAYMSLFGFYYLFGALPFLQKLKIKGNGYLILGSLGTIILLLILSFSGTWRSIIRRNIELDSALSSSEIIAAILTSFFALALLIYKKKNESFKNSRPIEFAFLLFVPIFIYGTVSSMAVVYINILLLVIGVLTIRDGALRNHLGILNYGLSIITVLVTCRFFDTDMSFVLRGILFVSVGVGFFVANYLMLQKRKVNE